MPTLDFGQPEAGIIQMAYVVDDIQAAMAQWTNDLHVGPWFLLDRFEGVDAQYRAGPSEAAVTLAMAFAGHLQIELLQPLDDRPSVYRETIDATGYGFHHYGIGSRDFDGDLARYEARGYDVAFRAGVPTGGSVAYLDTNGALPGFIELIELGPGMETAFTAFYAASLGWDGADPVRLFA
jgi:Glyoxalase/Bleomycin resistance protein/Dioxygenase superfamily